MATDYAALYKTYTNSQLLHLLENARSYQPDAVQAAERELDNRNLSLDELKYARQQLDAERNQPTFGQMDSVGNIISAHKTIFYTQGPLRNQLIGLFTLAALYSLSNIYGLIQFVVTAFDYGWETRHILLTVISMLLMPIATVLFAYKNKTGWIAMQAALINICISTISSMFFMGTFVAYSGFACIISVLLFAYLMKDEMLDAFGVLKTAAFTSFIIALAVWVLFYTLSF